MNAAALPIGSFIRMEKSELQAIVDRLKQLGYRTIGPRQADGAIIYDDLDSISQLPIGVIDEQDGGQYRLQQQATPSYFDYVVGPYSLKNFIFPPRELLLEYQRSHDGWRQKRCSAPDRPLAVLGPRSCDLQALLIQDRVFMNDGHADRGYAARRRSYLWQR